jgi:hypothetical protein
MPIGIARGPGGKQQVASSRRHAIVINYGIWGIRAPFSAAGGSQWHRSGASHAPCMALLPEESSAPCCRARAAHNARCLVLPPETSLPCGWPFPTLMAQSGPAHRGKFNHGSYSFQALLNHAKPIKYQIVFIETTLRPRCTWIWQPNLSALCFHTPFGQISFQPDSIWPHTSTCKTLPLRQTPFHTLSLRRIPTLHPNTGKSSFAVLDHNRGSRACLSITNGLVRKPQ